jgi:hypothetical protein
MLLGHHLSELLYLIILGAILGELPKGHLFLVSQHQAHGNVLR